MLEFIRERAQGFIAWVIVGAIVLSFSLWGVNEYFSDTDSGYQAATVNEEDVSVYQYQIAYQNQRARMQQMFGEQFDADMFDDQIKKSALESVIDSTLLVQNADEMGLLISDGQVFQRLSSIEAFQEEGRFSKAMYEQQLRVSGEPTALFENRVRRDSMVNQLVQGVAVTAFATPGEIKMAQTLKAQERHIGYLTLTMAEARKGVSVSDEEIAAHYEKNRESYKREEQLSLDYVELSLDQLAAEVTLEEGELEDYYEEQKSRFQGNEQRRARHILIATGDDEEAARKRIDELAAKIAAGESFEELAKAHSEDPGSAKQGGDLGFFGRGVMDAAFEEVAFALAKGEVSDPVRSQFGYHLIKVEEIRAGEGKDFAEVKDDLANELKRSRAEKDYFEKIELLANLAYESPQSLDAVIEEMGLVKRTTALFTRRGGSGIASERKVIDAAFRDEVKLEGQNSEVIELNKRALVVRVNEFKSAEVQPLNEVKGRINAQLRTDKAKAKVIEQGEAMLAKLRDGAKPEALAKEAGVTWNKPEWSGRSGGKINNEILRRAFTLTVATDKPAISGVVMGNGDYGLLQVMAVREGKPQTEDDNGQRLASGWGADDLSLVVDSLKDKASIKRFPGNL